MPAKRAGRSAASNWWSSLSAAAKKAYIAKHPNSSYAKRAKSAAKKGEPLSNVRKSRPAGMTKSDRERAAKNRRNAARRAKANKNTAAKPKITQAQKDNLLKQIDRTSRSFNRAGGALKRVTEGVDKLSNLYKRK